MKRKYFGTDGVRGAYGSATMNPTFAWRLGVAAGRWLAQRDGDNRLVLIGRDTRFSGPALEAGLAAGLSSVGAEVASLGVVPTPAVSFGVRHFGAALGVVVTASHNLATDNGIKFFSSAGTKLDDAEELLIESLLPPPEEAPEGDIACELPVSEVIGPFLDRLAGILPVGAIEGWRIAVDTANGASCQTTPTLLQRLGADVTGIGNEPNGHNINADCGSQHPGGLCKLVRETGARLGIAHDGDADRVVLVDENGEVVDGDELLAILAGDALKNKRLNGDTLVATVQSNLGLKRFMEDRGGRLVQTAVGDRYVAKALLAGGYNLGGENSGHIICTDISPCGDGLVAALLVLRAMVETGKPLLELRRTLSLFPQETRAVPVSRKPDIATLPGLSAAIREAEAQLGNDGRVLVRYSGTEPKIRLLVEGADAALVAKLIASLEDAVVAELGAPVASPSS